jgi:hypothetical protein
MELIISSLFVVWTEEISSCVSGEWAGPGGYEKEKMKREI